MSNFNGQTILEQANQLAHTRLQSFGLSDEELQEYLGFVASLNEVAVGELLKEPGIQLPDASEMIPLDDRTAMQAASLFCEGLIFTIFRCGEYRIPSELISPLTQQVAMHVYDQSKQIVAATHGQEHTPEFQISPEQQAEYITQGAESALLHYINEYEKQHGPINPDPEPEPETPQPSAAQPPAVAEQQQAQPQEQPDFWDEEPSAIEAGPTLSERPSPERGPAPSSASANHEKYGAVALLLTTLSAKQRARILNSFNPEEKELIAFYSYPQHVEQNLDAAKVESHLKKLKTLFTKREKVPATGSNRRLSALAGLISPEKLLSCVKDERPVVKRYLMGHLPGSAGEPEPDADPLTCVPPLSSRLEDIIYRYLSRRLAPELEQHLPESSSNQGSHHP